MHIIQIRLEFCTDTMAPCKCPSLAQSWCQSVGQYTGLKLGNTGKGCISTTGALLSRSNKPEEATCTLPKPPQFWISISYTDQKSLKRHCSLKAWTIHQRSKSFKHATKTIFIIALKYLKGYHVAMALDLSYIAPRER